MSASHIFTTGHEVVVITKGPGKLTLLSWDPVQGHGLTTGVGDIPTTRSGITHYVIGFSHFYTKFSFIWQGEGEAVYQIGEGLERKPVGRTWSSANTIRWGANSVTTEDVSANIASAGRVDRQTTAFIIPINIVSTGAYY